MLQVEHVGQNKQHAGYRPRPIKGFNLRQMPLKLQDHLRGDPPMLLIRKVQAQPAPKKLRIRRVHSRPGGVYHNHRSVFRSVGQER